MGNTLKTTVLLATLSGLLLVIGELLGGQSGLVIALGLAVVMNIGSYWFSDKIVLAMYRAQPVGPGHPLFQIVERLSQRAGLPMPKVYVIPDASPNAFTTGRNPEPRPRASCGCSARTSSPASSRTSSRTSSTATS